MEVPLHILVVEDDPATRRATCRLLQGAGYAVSSASTGQAARAALRKQPPHIVLLDRHLPDADGLEICREIKTDPATAETVLVVMLSSASVASEAQLEGLATGADGYFPRPIGNRELLTRLEAFARIARLTRKLAAAVHARHDLEQHLEARVQSRTADLAELAHRQQAEALAQAQEVRLQLAMEAAEAVAWEWDVATGAIRYSDNLTQIVRGEATEPFMSLEQVLKRIHPEDRAGLASALQRAAEAGEPLVCDYRALMLDGSWRWILARGRRAPGSAGSQAVVLGASVDITERKQAEERASGLRDLGFALAASADLATALPLCLESALRIAGMDGGGIFLVEEPRGDLRLACHQGLPEDFLRAVSFLPADSPQAGFARRGERHHIALGEAGESFLALERGAGFQALSVLPILHEGRLVAVLNVVSRSVPQVPAAARAALETVSGLLGGLINRLRTKQDLVAGAERMRALLASLEDMVFVLNRDLEFVECHLPATEEPLMPPAEFLGRRIDSLRFPEPARSRILHAVTHTRDTGEMAGAEYPLEKSGVLTWYELRATAMKGLAGEPAGLTCLVRNITRLKVAAAEVRTSEARYRLLAEGTEDFVTLFDEHWRRIYNSPSYSRRTGWTAEDLERSDYTARVHPDDLPTIQAMRAQITAGVEMTIEHRIRCQDGSWLWVEQRGKRIAGGEGQAPRYLLTARDITGRRQAELDLRANEAKFRSALAASPVPSALSDDQGRILYLNPAHVRTFGYQETELPTLAEWWQKAYPDPQYRTWVVAEWERQMAAARRTPSAKVELEVEICCRNGTPRVVVASMASLAGGFEHLGLVTLFDVTERKRSEQALRESHRQMEALFSNLPGMVYRCANDARWSLQFVSQGSLALTGHTPAQLVGNAEASFADLILPAHREAVWAAVQAALAERRAYELTYPIRNAAGAARWVWERGQGVYAEDGALLALEGLILDVTERQAAQAVLAKYQVLSQHTRDILLFVEPETGRIVEANAAAVDAYGYERAALLGLRISDLRVGESAEVIQAQLDQARREGILFQTMHRCRDGREFPVEVNSRAAQVEGKTLLLSVVRDISERVATQRKLERTAGLLAEAQRTARVGYYVNDLAAGVYEGSTVLDEIFGIDARYPHDLEHWGLLVHPDDRQQVLDHYYEVVEKGCPFRLDYRVVRPCDGAVRWVAAYGTLEYDAEGRPLRMVGCIQDIHDRKAAEQGLLQLAVATRKQSELLRSILESPQGLIIFSLDTEYCYTAFTVSHQRTAREIWGAEIAVGHNMLECIPFPADRELARQSLKRALAGEAFMEVQRYVEPAGLRLAWENRFAPIYADDRSVVGVAVFVTDVTERETLHAELEAKVAAATKEATELYNNAPCGYHSVAPDGTVLEINATELDWLGYARDEVVGKMRLSDFMPAAQLARFEERFADFKANSVRMVNEWEVRTKDGATLCFLVNSKPVQDAEGRYVKSFSTVLDITDRRRAEAELKRSQALLEAAFQAAPIEFWVRDLDGRCILENQTLVDHWGSMLGQRPEDAKVDAATLALWQENNRRAYAGETVVGEQTFVVQGQPRTYHNIIAPFQVDGQTQGLVGFNFDVTERRQLEATLRASEQRFRALFDSSLDAIITADETGRCVECNAAAVAMFGYADKAALLTGGLLALSPARQSDGRPSEEVMRERMGEIVARGGASFLWEHQRADGTVFPTEVSIAVVEVQNQKLLNGIIRDVSERHAAEQALRASKQRIEDLVNTIPDWVWEVNEHGVYTFCGPQAKELLGREPDEVLGKTPQDFFPSAEAARLGELVAEHFTHPQPIFNLQNQMVRKDGSRVTVETNAVPVVDADGKFRGYRGLDHDITRRVQAEADLQASEEKFRSIVQSSPVAMYLYQLEDDGRLVMTGANPAADRIIGIAHASLVGKTLEEAFPKLVGTKYPEMYRQVALGQLGPQEFEITYREERFAGSFGVNVFRTAPRFIAVSFLDISERKQAQAAIEASEEKYRLIFEGAGDGILVHDLAGRILASNPKTQASLGYTAQELRSLRLADLDTPAMARLIPARMEQLRQDGHATFESEHRRQDGTAFPVEVSAHTLLWEGQPAIMSLVRDLSERRRTEAQLRKLESAVEQSPVVVVITDVHGVIEYVNASFERQTGYSASAAVGQKPSLLKSGRQDAEFYREMWETLVRGETWRGELCNLRKDRTEFWELAVIAPLRDREGRITHFVAIKEDITQRRQEAEELRLAKQAAEAANQAKTTFLASISHEIRTPLNAILGFTQLLQHDATTTAAQQTRLHTIGQSGEHLLRLVNDLLDMAKIDAGRMSLTLADCDLHDLLTEVEGACRQPAAAKGLVFAVERVGAVPHFLRTDAGRVRQVLTNLLGNAIKFTTEGSVRLRVSATAAPPSPKGQPNERIWLEVTDTGPGIAPEEMPQVFAAFEQTQSGRQTAGGSGLGLAISRGLAWKLGGDITVASAMGQGTTFTFTFVAEVRDGAISAVEAPVLTPRVVGLASTGPAPRLLVVDDLEPNRHLLREVLEPLGFPVTEAVNGVEALQCCLNDPPALVLMDRRMPLLGGLEATRQLRAQPGGSAVRVLLVTADAEGFTEADWRDAGVDACLCKPLKNEVLLAHIGRLLQLEYVYFDPRKQPETRAPLDLAAAATLPADLRAELIQATETGDGHRLRELLAERVKPLQPALAEALGQMAVRYEYPQLLEALKSPAP